MKKRHLLKAAFSLVLLAILLTSSAQALTVPTVAHTKNPASKAGWHWIPPYPNYAPSGMPDFDQKQDRWKKIAPGPDGVIETPVIGDDVNNTQENCIAPGPDCYLDSIPAGDDVEEWVFCGPVAVANSLWWLDSKYADPAGTPGDGKDQFPLVQNYGAGDDHATANVPLLIQRLAVAMNTTNKGTTYINDMENALTTWINTAGLSDKLMTDSYDQPSFASVESEIEQNQNVILLLGSYDYITGTLLVDQSQLSGPHTDFLETISWSDFQSFIPTVTRLDAIDVLLVSNSVTPCNVMVDVYDTLYSTTPLGTATVNPGILGSPTWIRFNFTPYIALTPASQYYFDVRQADNNYHYEWFYETPNPYPPGQGWLDNQPVDHYGNTLDWAFQTLYFNPPPGSVRREGHYVTCAGVDSAASTIAISDPTLDIANATVMDHNDAGNVSHDVYNVSIGAPKPDIPCSWWFQGYPSAYNYTVVEKAVVIAPIPDTSPPSVTIIKPVNGLYIQDRLIFNLFLPIIIGKITIDVNAVDNDSGIDHVAFLIDGQQLFNDTTAPYSYTWSELAFFKYTIKVVAYDNASNTASASIDVWRFF
ncbi:MAG TPA: Ig-like domain-containing protein [Candidatus Thermoplasmatota archaeon]|nr:Ig-like domain-containing protein [Candidatus Thermoplasmatota archaeon]